MSMGLRFNWTGATIDGLASELDVTTRTIRRDLAALQEAGFPLYVTRDDQDRVRWRMESQAFKGLDTHARAIAAGAKRHGATVHFVVPEMDAGPIVAQAAVPVLDGDSEAALAARVLAVEHNIYPQALRLVAEGKTSLEELQRVFKA